MDLLTLKLYKNRGKRKKFNFKFTLRKTDNKCIRFAVVKLNLKKIIIIISASTS